MKILKIGSGDDPNQQAKRILEYVAQAGVVTTATIGAGALDVAVKAIAIARRTCWDRGDDRDLAIGKACFVDVTVEGQLRTSIQLPVEWTERREGCPVYLSNPATGQRQKRVREIAYPVSTGGGREEPRKPSPRPKKRKTAPLPEIPLSRGGRFENDVDFMDRMSRRIAGRK